MADLLKSLLGGKSGGAAPVDDFADFASDAAKPAAESFASITRAAASSATPASVLSTFFGQPAQTGYRGPYTKWYRIWERHTWKDFTQEYIVFTFIAVVVLIHLYGASVNRAIVRKWAKRTAPVLAEEYAVVGFGREERDVAALVEEKETSPLLVRENSLNEFISYATGRQNVAFVDIVITTFKRVNPIIVLGEYLASFFFESFRAPYETVFYTIYPFDGREKELVPESEAAKKSTYDDFVFAVVRKDVMQQLRIDRYDLSLAPTKDHPKLPEWAAIFSESAEITDQVLTSKLIESIAEAGDLFEYLIISDQPIDKPNKLEETVPKKRIHLSLGISKSDSDPSLPIVKYATGQLLDDLVTGAKFRPEVYKKVKATREYEQERLQRLVSDELREERAIAKEKEKKLKRDESLRGMSAEEQRRALEKERQKDLRKSAKGMKVRA